MGLLFALAGCSFFRPPLPTISGDLYYEAVGRFSARVEDKKVYTTRFRWIRNSIKDDIYIFTVLGNSLAQISIENGKTLVITSQGNIYKGDSPEKVIREVLGWSLPVKGLQFWLLGKSDPRANVLEETRDNLNRITGFSQQGWLIKYATFAEKQPLPKKIMLNYNELKLRIIVDRWMIGNLDYVMSE